MREVRDPVIMKLNSEKSSKVKKEDREYLDQVDLHSNAVQDEFNEQLAKLTPAQIELIAQRFKKRRKSTK